MRPPLNIAAATGSPAGRLRLLIVDEINPWPAESSVDAFILDHARRAVRPWEVNMRLREKGKNEVVHLGWDEAQAALQAGTHEVADAGGSGTPAAAEDAIDIANCHRLLKAYHRPQHCLT